MISSILLSTYNNTTLAEVKPSDIIKPEYCYGDDDIREVLKNKLDETNNYIAPALPFERHDLVNDIVQEAVTQAQSVGTALIPINFGNSHWASLAIKRTSTGDIKAIYNDSIGNPIRHKENSVLLEQILSNLNPAVEIIDLQVHQQTDGSSCGAFTAESLIKIAEIDISNLSTDELRNLLAEINDATALRKSHFLILGGHIDLDVPKRKVEITASDLKSQANQIVRVTNNINSFANSRLNYLNIVSNIDALPSGDEVLKYGL